jgi:hypothetical protein
MRILKTSLLSLFILCFVNLKTLAVEPNILIDDITISVNKDYLQSRLVEAIHPGVPQQLPPELFYGATGQKYTIKNKCLFKLPFGSCQIMLPGYNNFQFMNGNVVFEDVKLDMSSQDTFDFSSNVSINLYAVSEYYHVEKGEPDGWQPDRPWYATTKYNITGKGKIIYIPSTTLNDSEIGLQVLNPHFQLLQKYDIKELPRNGTALYRAIVNFISSLEKDRGIITNKIAQKLDGKQYTTKISSLITNQIVGDKLSVKTFSVEPLGQRVYLKVTGSVKP